MRSQTPISAGLSVARAGSKADLRAGVACGTAALAHDHFWVLQAITVLGHFPHTVVWDTAALAHIQVAATANVWYCLNGTRPWPP